MGIFASYIKLLQASKGNLQRPFDPLTREKLETKIKKLKDPQLRAEQLKIIEDQAQIFQEAKQILAELKNKNVPPLPDNEEERHRTIRELSDILGHAVSFLTEDEELLLSVGRDKVKEYARSFLHGVTGLQNNEVQASFYIQLCKIYDNEDPAAAYDHLFQAALKFTSKDRFLKYLAIGGKAYFTEKLIEAYKEKLEGQNELVELLQNDFKTLNVGQTLSEQEKELKKILDEDLFSAIKLDKNQIASQLREFDAAIKLLKNDMMQLSQTANAADLSILNNEDQAKFEIFLLPYQKLAEMENPFPSFNEEEAKNAGLKIVSSTTGGLYVGDQDRRAQEFIYHLKKEFSKQCSTNSDFLKWIALCSANQGEFARFLSNMKMKYGINNKHPLFDLCEKGGAGPHALTIKAVQVLPRLKLLVEDLYPETVNAKGKIIPSKEARAFSHVTAMSNKMEMKHYIENPLIENAIQDNINIHLHLTLIKKQFFLHDTQSEIKAAIKQQLKNYQSNTTRIGDDTQLMLNMLLSCRKYYSLTMAHSGKAMKIVKELDTVIPKFANDKNNFIDLTSFAELLKLKKGEHRSQIHRLFHVDDTLTSTIKNTLKAIEEVEKEKKQQQRKSSL